MLGNRLKKRYKHLKKWAKRSDITCFRLYEKDIPEFPLIVDWYDGEVVVWIKKRKRDETEEQEDNFKALCLEEIKSAFDFSDEKIHVKERRRQRDDGKRSQYERVSEVSVIKNVQEQGLQFEVNLSDYLDTGLFLDHRIARSEVRKKAKGKRVLNLFAYTGAFSSYAMDGGAKHVTTVDMSRTYIEWSKRNMSLNGFDETLTADFIVADCLKWLKEAQQDGLKFDLIVCDPPTFSNSKKMEESSFSIDRDHPYLLIDISKLLDIGGELMFSNNSRNFELETSLIEKHFEIEPWSHKSISEDFRNEKIHQSWWLTKKT